MMTERQEDDACFHPQHRPPQHMVYRPGIHEHTCPGCGRTITFTVTGPRWGAR